VGKNPQTSRKWWKEAVVYQVYPRSFMDSNGDGVGDIVGIISKLDYLKWLGVDVLWLSPIYKSPNDDNGYDISDYRDIMTEFGTMADFDRLLKQAHRRGIKIILDLVVNHTSDEHPWFVESRSSKKNPKRDWYVWRTPRKGGKEPNNWASGFAKSAWELDKNTGEYYLHIFSKKQPDLNWHNPKVKNAVFDMMRWWLDKGIDGFRMDVINGLIKARGFPDVKGPNGKPVKGYASDSKLLLNQPGMHELLNEMNRRVLSKYDILTVGECHGTDPSNGPAYVETRRKELDMMFQFNILYCRNDFVRFKKMIGEWYAALKGRGWNTITLGNHDTPRMVTIFGNDKRYRVESAKLLATFLLTVPGTPFFLQGDEIGMTNVCFPSIDYYRDIEMLHRYNMRIEKGMKPKKILDELRPFCRDNARTPMQWDGSKHAGFSKGTPWINVNPNFASINVKRAMADKNSVLNYYRTLLALRKKHTDIIYGDYRALADDDPHVYAFLREGKKARYLVALNFSDKAHQFQLPVSLRKKPRTLLACSHATPKEKASDTMLKLGSWESQIYQVG
jgi:oligo-1,6-glucosidase